MNGFIAMDQGHTPVDPPRRMVRAVLAGSHSHATASGINVHIYRRDGKYLARGRYQRRLFGATLGSSEKAAVVRLRQLLVDEFDVGLIVSFIDCGRFRCNDLSSLEMRFIGPVHRRSSCLILQVFLCDQRIQPANIFFF